MTTTAFRRIATAAIAASFVAVGANVALAPAHAQEDKNDVFIDFLDKKGVPYSSRTDAIRMAKQFCLDSNRQGNPNWLAGYNLAFKGGWTESEATKFVEGAVYTYCPRAWGLE